MTINCPHDCPYLLEARSREKPADVDRAGMPNADIEVTDSFLNRHAELIAFIGFTLNRAIRDAANVVDSDVRDALDSLAQTYRTLTTGLYYESVPANPYAAALFSRVQQAVPEYRDAIKQRGAAVRDGEILGVLVTFQRLSLSYNNGRPKGRFFLDFLRTQFPVEAESPRASSPLIEI